MFYPLTKKLLFTLPPEQAHIVTMKLLHHGLNVPGFARILGGKIGEGQETKLSKTVAGLTFPNPIGMAAGFDKNAQYFEDLGKLGFGFVEIGTVTPKPQPGNEKPRLFRLPKDEALINRMGFNNDGMDAVAERLAKRKTSTLIIGGNIGKNKITPNKEAVSDYLLCFKRLFDVVDYFVVNVSSPNTPNLRELQDKESLGKILGTLQNENQGKKSPKSVFLKIAPDLSTHQLDEIISITQETKITGLIATNTTISREGLTTNNEEVTALGMGGLSGNPLRKKALEILTYLKQNCASGTILISSGGIMNPNDIKERITAGADLIQLYTGFIYGGPGLIGKGKKILTQYC